MWLLIQQNSLVLDPNEILFKILFCTGMYLMQVDAWVDLRLKNLLCPSDQTQILEDYMT